MKIPSWLLQIRKWSWPQSYRTEVNLDARVVNAVERLAAMLAVSSADEKTLAEATDAWVKSETARLLKQYSPAQSVRLPWWNYIRNPVWSIAFTVQRQRLARAGSQNVRSLQKLDYLLGRAEFMFTLSWYAKQGFREQIANGSLSRWRAFSLILSGAFSMTSEGDVRPRGVGTFGLWLGTTLALQMAIASVAFAVVMVVVLRTPCAQECLAFGASQLMVFTGVVGYNAWSWSWGRRQKARQLTQIFGHLES